MSNTNNGAGSIGGGSAGEISNISDGNQSISFKTTSKDSVITDSNSINEKFGDILDKFRVMKGAEGNRCVFRRC
jgi:hypothetical protein